MHDRHIADGEINPVLDGQRFVRVLVIPGGGQVDNAFIFKIAQVVEHTFLREDGAGCERRHRNVKHARRCKCLLSESFLHIGDGHGFDFDAQLFGNEVVALAHRFVKRGVGRRIHIRLNLLRIIRCFHFIAGNQHTDLGAVADEGFTHGIGIRRPVTAVCV